MAAESVYPRWGNTIPPYSELREVEIELSLFYPKTLVRRWGRIDTRRPGSVRMVISNPDELERWVGFIARRRERHGYCVEKEIRSRILGAS